MVPASRASMWRHGYANPADYDDNGRNCGGFHAQWELNAGRCGLCGDNWSDAVREHETPNKYGNEIITGMYQPNEEIEVLVEVTANHEGYFTFRLCAAEPGQDPSQDCLDQSVLLVMPEMTDRYVLPSTKPGVYSTHVRLPDIECERCVLQWTYTAGNTRFKYNIL